MMMFGTNVVSISITIMNKKGWQRRQERMGVTNCGNSFGIFQKELKLCGNKTFSNLHLANAGVSLCLELRSIHQYTVLRN